MHDPLLKARREALDDLLLDLSENDYNIAERAIDLYLDKLEYDISHVKHIEKQSGSLTAWGEI